MKKASTEHKNTIFFLLRTRTPFSSYCAQGNIALRTWVVHYITLTEVKEITGSKVNYRKRHSAAKKKTQGIFLKLQTKWYSHGCRSFVRDCTNDGVLLNDGRKWIETWLISRERERDGDTEVGIYRLHGAQDVTVSDSSIRLGYRLTIYTTSPLENVTKESNGYAWGQLQHKWSNQTPQNCMKVYN